MNKIIFRITLTIFLFMIIVSNFKSIDMIEFLNNSSLGKLISVFFVSGVIYLWGFMFFHWGTHNFSKKLFKIFWFWVMLLGLFFGAFIYYIFVYELKKTLKEI